MERPTCQTCPYWDNSHDNAGECHRLPPTFPPTETLAKEGLSIDNDLWNGWFPNTSETEWCGEHPDFPAYIKSLKTGKIVAKPQYGATWQEFDHELDIRTRKTLYRLGKDRLADIARTPKKEIMGIKNFGISSLHMLSGFLANHGFRTSWFS